MILHSSDVRNPYNTYTALFLHVFGKETLLKISGIAPGLSRLYNRNGPAFDELVYLATQALQLYRATTLITSLYQVWDQALAKAALHLDIPIQIALPYRDRELFMRINNPQLYRDLLAKAENNECLSETFHDTVDIDCHRWRATRSDLVMALWDYDFCGDTFQVIDHALKAGKQVVNLWEDWSRLGSLHKELAAIFHSKQTSDTQIFSEKS
jgi:hypothetical protein